MTSAAPETRKTNIVLIGMAACGKSTVGALLAKTAGLDFVDTDIIIQQRRNRPLQHLLDTLGLAGFIAMEQEEICRLQLNCHAIATGGSAIYGSRAMQHLKDIGTIVHLDVPLEDIVARLQNHSTRGLAIGPGMTLRDLYYQRESIYQKWAEVSINCHQRTPQQIVDEILRRLPIPECCRRQTT